MTTWGQATLSTLSVLHAATRGPHSLAVLDVDALTRINEQYGWAAGDAVLEDAERYLASEVINGLTERWVGDQFLILLPFTSPTDARPRLEAIVASFRTHPCSPPYTLCAGGASSPLHGLTNVDLVTAAAAALRRAKERGPGSAIWACLNLNDTA